MENKIAFIILAAGRGKRLNSTFSKVLHEIGGKPMIVRTVETLEKLKPQQIIAVVGFDAKGVKKVLKERVDYAYQEEQLGTGHAASIGAKSTDANIDTVVVLNGDDSAFYKAQTIQKVIDTHNKSKSALSFVSLEPQDATGLGRVVRKNGQVIKIVEEKDATEDEKKIKEVNDGLYVVNKNWFVASIDKLEKTNVAGEYYLVDLVKVAIDQGLKVSAYKLEDPTQWHGVNTPEELKAAKARMPNAIHIMGIAGAGASAVAEIAAASRYQVTGCDLNPNSPYLQNPDVQSYSTSEVEQIRHIGKIEKGHSKKHLENIDMLVFSPAVEKLDSKNEELVAAKEKNIPTITWQEFQGKYLQKDKFVIAVAGAYGKSTTTAMIAQILTDAKFDPTCEIGAKVLDWGTNFRVGKSKYYVCESDEYNNNFLNYRPDIAVILNVAWDHPDFFKTKGQLIESYKQFIKNIKPGGTLIIPDSLKDNHPELGSGSIVKNLYLISVKDFGKTKLSILGDFRKQNADAALTLAEVLNIKIEDAKKSLATFKGLGRRLEYKGEIENVKFYDDYAVQPYTILKTANALKEKFKDQKIILVLEPHTFSRINTFFSDFVKSLKESKVDEILITDVYAAREAGDDVQLAKKLAKSIGLKARYVGPIEQSAQYVASHLQEFDIVCSMGAGESYKLYNIASEI